MAGRHERPRIIHVSTEEEGNGRKVRWVRWSTGSKRHLGSLRQAVDRQEEPEDDCERAHQAEQEGVASSPGLLNGGLVGGLGLTVEIQAGLAAGLLSWLPFPVKKEGRASKRVRLRRERISPPPWPRRLQRIRRECFDASFVRTMPGQVALGSWVVSALLGRRPVGLAWLIPSGVVAQACVIEEVAVISTARGRSIGSQLVEECLRWGAELEFSEVWITSLRDADRSRREGWFRKLGFVALHHGLHRRALRDEG